MVCRCCPSSTFVGRKMGVGNHCMEFPQSQEKICNVFSSMGFGGSSIYHFPLFVLLFIGGLNLVTRSVNSSSAGSLDTILDLPSCPTDSVSFLLKHCEDKIASTSRKWWRTFGEKCVKDLPFFQGVSGLKKKKLKSQTFSRKISRR